MIIFGKIFQTKWAKNEIRMREYKSLHSPRQVAKAYRTKILVLLLNLLNKKFNM
jgi:hypothetical protein